MSDGSVQRASVRPVANAAGGPLEFPVLAAHGAAVVAADHRSPGTGLHSALAALAAIVAVGRLAATTYGLAWWLCLSCRWSIDSCSGA